MILRSLYSIHIYMLKISYRLSRFLTKWYFLRQSFLHARFQIFLVILLVPYKISKTTIIFLYREYKQENVFDHAFWIRQS